MFVGDVASVLEQSYPSADTQACYEVVVGIAGIYFNIEAMTPLGKLKKMRASSKSVALRLLATL